MVDLGNIVYVSVWVLLFDLLCLGLGMEVNRGDIMFRDVLDEDDVEEIDVEVDVDEECVDKFVVF